MNWHETIEHIRKEPSFEKLVVEAYLSADLKSNVEAFRNSSEFKATLQLFKDLNIPQNSTLLDVGAGNGISSIAFALEGFNVTSLEPDLSDTIGAGAINKLKDIYKIADLDVASTFGEEMPFPDNKFDVVYARQCMHHANNLPDFTKSMFRVLRNGGWLLTVRDHVANNEAEKQAFLKKHPLQQFYGGENAFKLNEYKNAITDAGFKIKTVIGPAESVINYAPWDNDRVKYFINKKIGEWASPEVVVKIAWRIVKFRMNFVPGRLYTIIAQK